MSEQNTAHVSASVNTGMSVGGSGRPGRVRFHAKLMGLILTVCVVLATGAGYVFWHTSRTSPTNNAKSMVKAPPANTPPDQKAQFYADEGEYQQAEQSWQDQLAGAKTPSDKASIYFQQSALAVRFEQYGDAKKYADEAKQVAPDSPQPNVALAQLYAAQDNVPQAKYYWQQAINHVNSNMPGYNMMQADYKQQLDALK